MHVYQYDILKDTWIYADIKQQIQEEEYRAYVQEYQQMLQSIVQARFPRLVALTKEVSRQVIDPAMLRDLIVQISTAKVEKVARQCLNEQKQQCLNEQKQQCLNEQKQQYLNEQKQQCLNEQKKNGSGEAI
jgi:hypothetical protein